MSASPTSAELDQLRHLIEKRLGLRFEDHRVDELRGVIEDRIRALGLARAGAYLELLDRSPTDRHELRAVAERVTIGETYFFRHREQWQALAEVALPERVLARAASQRLRMLSAGCASGEEAYTLAILARERLLDRSGWPVEIQGLDINPAALKKAARAVYSSWSLRETDPALRDRYFRFDGREYTLEPGVRDTVTFTEGNLLEPDPAVLAPGSLDIVFCRNVFIYFGAEAMRAAIAHLIAALAPGGYLFLGHAENLRGLSNEFHLCHTHGTFYYRKLDGRPPGMAVTVAQPVPRLPPPDDTWVDVIQRASDRIALLARDHADRAPEGEPVAAKPAWDRSGILSLLAQERFGEASAALAALPGSTLDDPDAQLLVAVLHANRRELDRAREVCERLLQLDDLNAGAHYLMALCRESAGDAAGAFHHDRIAAHLDPSFAMPRFHMGLMARRAGDAERAAGELAAALHLFEREESARILLFGGGFSREALVRMCSPGRVSA